MNQRPSKTMKAVAIDRFGGIETLKTRELPIPDVGADEVGVRVEAAGVGVWDPFEREGGFAPAASRVGCGEIDHLRFARPANGFSFSRSVMRIGTPGMSKVSRRPLVR